MYAARVRVIRELIRERDVNLARVDRNANRVSYELARLVGLTLELIFGWALFRWKLASI
jgi:hypothetical protein